MQMIMTFHILLSEFTLSLLFSMFVERRYDKKKIIQIREVFYSANSRANLQTHVRKCMNNMGKPKKKVFRDQKKKISHDPPSQP